MPSSNTIMKICEKIPSELDAIPGFLNKAMGIIAPLPIDEEEAFKIKLALSEALINAIKHGNKFNTGLFVEATIETSENELSVAVKDQGDGFDFQALADPTKEENLTKNSGRGVYLIKKLMDKVSFSDGGRTVKMTKFFKKGEAV